MRLRGYLDEGMNRRQVKNEINKMLSKETKGFFKDTGWKPVNRIFKRLTDMGFSYSVDETRYSQDSEGNLTGKTWKFTIDVEGGKPIHGVIIASGAGKVEDPLGVYDLTAYVS
jgi:hypothetical protein